VTSATDLLRAINTEFAQAVSERDLAEQFSSKISQFLLPDIIAIHYRTLNSSRPSSILGQTHLEFRFQESNAYFYGHELSSPIFASVNTTSFQAIVSEVLLKTPYQACALIPLHLSQDEVAILEISFLTCAVTWKYELRVFLEKVSQILEANLCRLFLAKPSAQQALDANFDNSPLSELSENSFNLITVETNDKFIVTSVGGNPEKLLGLDEAQIIGSSELWARILHPSDAKKLLLKTQRGSPKELQDEFRIVHQVSGEVRALLVSAKPRFAIDGNFEGWSGFALDVTGRYHARRELIQDRLRLEALYRLGQSIQTSSNTPFVALESLKTLIQTTQADAGIMVLFQRGKSPTEISAAYGFELSSLEDFERSPSFALNKNWIHSEDKVLVLESEHSLKWLSRLFEGKIEGWRVAQVRLEFEESALGCLLIFNKKQPYFSTADLELLDVAAGQISLAIRQAELFVSEKEQAQSLAALYRLTHEISKQLTSEDVINRAVPIIKEELACKRIWLGTVNEQQTQLSGQAGIGPGIRDGVIDLKIDLTIPHPFLDIAIKSKNSVVVPFGSGASCQDLSIVFERLDLSSFVIVPLVSLGQVVGVLMAEPLTNNAFFSERSRQLLNSMASEIAAVILARRFEARIADDNKMRMASLLASGVAHNFNNLLQAIMGQASLIELDSLSNEQKGKVARMIMDAAEKGAKLVKQMYSFSSESTFSPDSLSLNNLLLSIKDKLQQILGPHVQLEYSLSQDSMDIQGDASMISQLMNNLIDNCRSALEGRENAHVKISAYRTRVRAGEVHSDLNPGSYICLTIEDNGIGMPKEVLNRCFEPFYSTKNVDPRTGLSFSGGGLGLTAAYLIIKQHAGVIIANSTEGSGSSFSVYLPILTLKAKVEDKDRLRIEGQGQQSKISRN
jgi:PAS domain S-box-containing protein